MHIHIHPYPYLHIMMLDLPSFSICYSLLKTGQVLNLWNINQNRWAKVAPIATVSLTHQQAWLFFDVCLGLAWLYLVCKCLQSTNLSAAKNHTSWKKENLNKQLTNNTFRESKPKQRCWLSSLTHFHYSTSCCHFDMTQSSQNQYLPAVQVATVP